MPWGSQITGIIDHRLFLVVNVSVSRWRALINNPVLVLADEPTGNLDRKSADLVMDLICSINQKMATSFLLSTHDEHIAAQCPRRIELLDGKIARS